MTKVDLIERITNQKGFTKVESADLIESLLEIMKEALADGETVKISGFGSFIVREKNDRRGRNPQTGEQIIIDARRVLTFKPSAVLKASING